MTVRAPGDVLVHLRRARDHLDRHFAEPHELAEVAAVAGLSKYPVSYTHLTLPTNREV